MIRIQDIEKAIRELSPEELARFREWFVAYDAQVWDREIEDDAKAGRLDALLDEAAEDLRKGRCTDL